MLAHPKCRGSVPLDIVGMLLKMAPQMAETRHLYTGNLPLHAVFYNAFFSSSKRAAIADMIIRANPQSVLMTNYDGRTPLHTNCTQHCNYEPVVALLRAAPQTAKWTDKNNELPLHLACRSQKTPNKSIRALFHAFPDGIFCKNGQGLTPLEIAKASRIIEQRKSSRVALLTTLEAQHRKTQKLHGSSNYNQERNMCADDKHCMDGNIMLNHVQYIHQAPKRKLEMISDDHPIWSPQKSYRRYIDAHNFHVAGKLSVGGPIFPTRIVVPSNFQKVFYNNYPSFPRLNVREFINADQMDGATFDPRAEVFMKMKLQRQEHLNIGHIRKQQIPTRKSVHAEECCAITLISMKNQNEK